MENKEINQATIRLFKALVIKSKSKKNPTKELLEATLKKGYVTFATFPGHKLIVDGDTAYLFTGKKMLALNGKEYLKRSGRLVKARRKYGVLRNKLSSLTEEKNGAIERRAQFLDGPDRL